MKHDQGAQGRQIVKVVDDPQACESDEAGHQDRRECHDYSAYERRNSSEHINRSYPELLGGNEEEIDDERSDNKEQ